jgi:hypothetical protein
MLACCIAALAVIAATAGASQAALAQYFSADSSQRALAAGSVTIVKQINDELAGADSKAGFRTADVAGAFDTYDSTDLVPFDGQSIPVNVARVCSWTWNCTPRRAAPTSTPTRTAMR